MNRVSITRRTALKTIGGAAALPALGFAGQVSAAEPKRGGTLTFLMLAEPTTLVALTTLSTSTITVSAKITEGLLDYDFDLKPRPQLAISWSAAADGLSYTFKLRPGVKWHDGKDFTSADVAYSIQLLKTVHARGRSTFANLVRVDTPDPLTAVFVLSQPAPFLMTALVASESPMMPRHIYEGTDPMANPNGNAPIGTGPFRFKEWVRGSHIMYERNPDYWDQPRPYLDRILFRFFPDAGARSIAFETGSVDVGYRNPVSLGDLDRLKKVPSLRFTSEGYNYNSNISALVFNLDSPIFGDLKVRQAIAHAIDRKVIIRTVQYGYGTITESPIAPGLKAFHDPTPSPYQLDLKKAEALLDAAGHPRGADRVRFRIALDYSPMTDDPRRTAEYLRSALARIGIAVEARAQDSSAYLKRIYSDRAFDFTVNNMSNLFDPTVGVQRIYWSKNFRKGVPFSNGSHYDNPKVDALLEAAAIEIDHAKRVALFREFQQIVGAELPDINLYSPNYVTVYNQRVHDHTTSAVGLESNLAHTYVT